VSELSECTCMRACVSVYVRARACVCCVRARVCLRVCGVRARVSVQASCVSEYKRDTERDFPRAR
jgi:hypothetical protein